MHLICRRWNLLEVSISSWVGLGVKLLCCMLLGSLSLCIHILLPDILLIRVFCDSSSAGNSRVCGCSSTHDADDDDTDGWDDHKQHQRCE